MSRRIGAVAVQSSTDFSPGGDEKVNGKEFLCFPMRYRSDPNFVPNVFYPFSLSLERAMEYFHRFKELRVQIAIGTGDPQTSLTFDLTLPRDTIDEMDLLFPGLDSPEPATCSTNYLISGSQPGWNGDAESTLSYSVLVQMFLYGPPSFDYRLRVDNEVFFPSFAFIFNVTYTTPGSALYAIISSVPFTDATAAIGVSAFPAHGGAVVSCATDSSDPSNTTITATITPHKWFEWRDRDGDNPRWNENTGLTLF